MKHWLFQVMYDSYPQSWKGMIEMGIAAQHYPLSRNWDNAKRNNNALSKLGKGDFIVASFKDHRFAGYGKLKSDFYVRGPSLRIPHLISGELMEFHERFDCEWTIIPFDRNRPFIRCDDVKRQGFDIDMMRGQCVKQIDENTFEALKLRLDNSGAKKELPTYKEISNANVVESLRKYWLWVTSNEIVNKANLAPSKSTRIGWTCDENTEPGDLVLLYCTSKGRTVKGSHKSAFCYLVQAKTKAYDGGEKWSHWREQGWKWACDYKILYEFENPVGFKDLKQRDSEFKGWEAYKRNNFQGTSFGIPEDIWNKLDQMASEKNPSYPGYRKFIAMPVSSFDSKMKFTANEYASAFQNLQIAPHQMQMLLVNYFAPNRTLTASTMANAMGYDHYTAANLHYGTLGGLVGEKLGWNPLPEFKVNVLVDFEKPGEEWSWIMKPAVAKAIEHLGWIEATSTIPEEVDVSENKPIYEGAVRKVSVNAYERSNIAREKCLHHYGCKCTVCGMKLSDFYGEIAQGYIHVHHLRQLSEINSEYQIDPIADLRPVCPTCHSIIHLGTPPYSIEEVKEFIKSQRGI